MCGIAGWFSSQTIPPQELQTLKQMIQRIKHRGPDGQGEALLSHACFGHARLSIIDLSSGQQPMHSHDQRYTISFNGEIYNYKMLRAELLDSGHKFNTQSDTEVIMEIYRKHGNKGFSRLRGMYAFALWDNEEKKGLLVRDPMGIKPLFYQQTSDNCLVFASEAKAIFAKTAGKPALDTEQLHLLMNFRYIPGNGSLFRGIEQLPAGKIMQWQTDNTIKYFDIDIPEVNQETTLAHIRQSVNVHMISDVEVGCYLSGGIDSSTIAAICSEGQGNGLRTFTLDVGDDPLEATYAAETAKHFGLQNLQFKVGQDITQDFKKLLWHLEVPKINAAQNWQLARQTSQHVKVVLSGLGGDELFLGYNAHKIMTQAYSVSNLMPESISRLFGSLFNNIYRPFNKLHWSEPERALMMFENLGNWSKVYGLARNIWDGAELRKIIYGERMLSADLPNAFDRIEQQWPEHKDPVTAMAKFEWRQKMVNDLLWQEDRVSMAHGLEVRTPFVDRVMYNHVNNFSRDYLMKNGQLKGYMKKTVEPVLPQKILNRPKSGFQVSSFEFFHTHLSTLAKEQLTETRINEIGLFNYQFVAHVLKFPPDKRLRWHYFILYFMILTHLWIQVFESDGYFQQP